MPSWLSQLTRIFAFSALCSATQIFNDQTNLCESCGKGQIPVVNRNTVDPTKIISCKDCQPFEIVSGSTCVKCPDGEIPNDDKNQCIPCADNEITPGCRDTCIDCDIGKVPNDDKTACVGKYSHELLSFLFDIYIY